MWQSPNGFDILGEIAGQVAEKFEIADKVSPCFLSFMRLFPGIPLPIDICIILDMWACKQQCNQQ
jgi:hypothetical protein